MEGDEGGKGGAAQGRKRAGRMKPMPIRLAQHGDMGKKADRSAPRRASPRQAPAAPIPFRGASWRRGGKASTRVTYCSSATLLIYLQIQSCSRSRTRPCPSLTARKGGGIHPLSLVFPIRLAAHPAALTGCPRSKPSVCGSRVALHLAAAPRHATPVCV